MLNNPVQAMQQNGTANHRRLPSPGNPHVCRHCDVPAFYRPRADPTQYMIDVRCLEGVDLGSLQRVSFDGRNWELRPDAPYRGIWKTSGSD